jgi:hypothetical protein
MQKTHEALKPLTWLIGRWVSINAAVAYPTMKPVTYCEEVTYESLGQPLLNYQSRSWHPDSGEPIHIERGFLRIKPGTKSSCVHDRTQFGGSFTGGRLRSR